MFRENKGTANQDAVRTLMAGLVISLVILFLFDPARRLFQHHVLRQPWIEATIAVATKAGARPDLIYGVRARTTVSAEWRTWTESASGSRICIQEGPGHYERNQPVERWAWDAWFVNGCDVPEEPYRVCIRYGILTPRWARDVSRPFCSNLVRSEASVGAVP